VCESVRNILILSEQAAHQQSAENLKSQAIFVHELSRCLSRLGLALLSTGQFSGRLGIKNGFPVDNLKIPAKRDQIHRLKTDFP